MRFGSKVLFDDVTTTFSAGAPVRADGSERGRQVDVHEAADGRIRRRSAAPSSVPEKLGVLRQDQFAFDKFRVLDTVIMGNERLWSALTERDALYAQAGDDERRRHASRRARRDRRRGGRLFGGERRGGAPAGTRHRRTRSTNARWRELQGGQKMRVLLAQALFGHPDALLLDEPTNHLDLDSIHWLREFLDPL